MKTPQELFDLTGRVALVTGATRGLGRAISVGLAHAGADVIVSSRKQEACDELAVELRQLGREALPVACHVGHWGEVERLAERAYDSFGRVDILINNAGLSPLYPDPVSVTEELWDKVLGVNLKGPFRLTALVGTRMKSAGSGSIINISSIGAYRASGAVLPYSAAKAGLNALTTGFADAFGPEVRVNTIMPGPFLTSIARGWDMERFEATARAFPLRRGGQAEEIVGAVLYFASDAASYTTGAALVVDGGVTWSRPDSGDIEIAPRPSG
jgi:NAD(P)-dependent dehydrogenase (short-subunit alcohol dehydrogenase family)